MDKLDGLKGDIAEIKTQCALNSLAYNNLNAELQEYKDNNKWRANRNIAIVAIMFTALGCWVGIQGLNTGKHIPATIFSKEINSNDHRNTND